MWCVQLVGLPIQPYLIIPYWRFRWVTYPVLDVWVGHGYFLRAWYLCPPGGQKALLSPFMLGGGALWAPSRDPHLRTALPLAYRRSHAFLACIGLGTSPAYQGIYSASSCCYDCGGIGIGHFLLPGSTSWCPALVGGWLLMPTGGLPWPPGGPHHVGFSHETWTDLLVGWMTGRWWWPHCIGLLPAGWHLHLHNWLISEDKMSWIASSLSQGLHDSGAGDLLRRYTSWYRSQIFFWEVW